MDVITRTKTLTVVADFDDGDDRSILIDNPRDNITWADIQNFAQYANNVLVGDKTGAAFNRIKSAHITNRYTNVLDPENL